MRRILEQAIGREPPPCHHGLQVLLRIPLRALRAASSALSCATRGYRHEFGGVWGDGIGQTFGHQHVYCERDVCGRFQGVLQNEGLEPKGIERAERRTEIRHAIENILYFEVR